MHDEEAHSDEDERDENGKLDTNRHIQHEYALLLLNEPKTYQDNLNTFMISQN